jgi:hypothetical protein
MKPQREKFVFRTHSRVPVHTPMIYVGKDFAGQGVVRELSRVGCRILGNYPVTPGETLSLRISHPTSPDPFFIEQVGVRWVKGFNFSPAGAIAGCRHRHSTSANEDGRVPTGFQLLLGGAQVIQPSLGPVSRSENDGDSVAV